MSIALLVHPAHAFAPDVPREIARAAFAPEGASAHPLGETAANAVDARLLAEEETPEAYAAAHVYFAPAAGDPPPDAPVSALTALMTAYDALALAFSTADAGAIARSTGALAISAADLADPFRTAGAGRSGPAGAWARFTDRSDPADPLVFEPTASGPVVDARSAGANLAARSAATRDSVEAMAITGRDEELASLRHARIADALRVVRGLVAGASRAALATSPVATASVFPNPARGHALLMFRATVPGTARVRVTSVSGRRIAEFDEPVQAGAAAIALDAKLPGALAPGAYFVSVTAPGVEAVARFIRIAP